MVLVIGDAAVLTSRIDRLDVAATSAAGSAAGSAADGTWLLIGTDSRADLPDGPDRYGTTAEAGGGSRADVLALVRSRHPEVLRDGTWAALSDVEGAQQRSRYSGVVMKALLGAVRADAHDPLALQRLAWSVSGNTSISSGTGVLDLLDLARSLASSGAVGIDVVDVPAPTVGDTFHRLPDGRHLRRARPARLRARHLHDVVLTASAQVRVRGS